MDGAGIRAALSCSGAAGVQLGTALHVLPQKRGTTAAHRAALATATATTVTRAFSGRPARGIRNRMTDAFAVVEAAPFPQQQHLPQDIRHRAAAAAGRADLVMQLWAGQGAPLVRDLPAAELVRVLATEAGL